MGREGSENGERLQSLMDALVARRIEESLGRVETALAAWRKGERDLFAAHGEVLGHAARAGTLSARIARAGIEGPDQLLRDAYEAGLLDRAEFVALAGRPPEEVPVPPPLDQEAEREAAPPMPDKRSVIDKLLEDGAVLLHVDSRRDGVRVPEAHRADPKLVLRVGHRLTPRIPDLVIDGDGVRATLTFRGVPFACVIPWPAVYAIVAEDSRGLIWPEDVPPEVARDFAHKPRAAVERREPPDDPPRPRGGHLKLVT